jgi:hypothetical protein
MIDVRGTCGHHWIDFDAWVPGDPCLDEASSTPQLHTEDVAHGPIIARRVEALWGSRESACFRACDDEQSTLPA